MKRQGLADCLVLAPQTACRRRSCTLSQAERARKEAEKGEKKDKEKEVYRKMREGSVGR